MASVLPSLSRRLFLRGAAVAAPLAVVPALAAAASAYAEENPALLALEPELVAAEVEMIAAGAAYEEALRIGKAMWPRAPEAISYAIPAYEHGTVERDILGCEFADRKGVHSTKCLRHYVDHTKRWRKITPEREVEKARLQGLYAGAEAYEAACAHASEASGFSAAKLRRQASFDAMRGIVDRVHAEPARTMAGVAVKARTARAWSKAPNIDRVLETMQTNLAGNLAASLLAVLEG